MNMDINIIIIANYILLGLIAFIIIFIFSRRILFFPFQLWFFHRKEYYKDIAEYLIDENHDNSRLIKFLLNIKNPINKLALGEILLEKIDTLNGDKKKFLIQLYEKSGIVDWRIRQLESVNTWKRRIAADILGKSYSRKAVTPLIISLRDKDEDVRLIAAKALGKLKVKGAIEYIISLFKDFPEEKCPIVADILIDYGEEAVPSITKALDSIDLKTRFWSVRALSEINIINEKFNYKTLEEKLLELLEDEDDRVRAYGVVSLAKIGSQDKAGSILKLLKDRSEIVRSKAAIALGILRNSEAIEALIKSLSDRCWDVNYASSKALMEFSGQVEDRLKENLKNPKNIVRKRCKEILEEILLQKKLGEDDLA